jgi:hypothetical protein
MLVRVRSFAMPKRRLSFAAPFVVVVACSGASKPAPVIAPPDRPSTSGLSSDECKALVADSPCTQDGATCNIEGDGCGLIGYTCRSGTWSSDYVACNPPPPS